MKEEITRTYVLESLRHLHIEVQILYRQSKLDSWKRFCDREHFSEKGAVNYTAEEITKIIGVLDRKLYYRKNPVPKSLQPLSYEQYRATHTFG